MKGRWRKWLAGVIILLGMTLLVFQRPLRIAYHRGFVKDGRNQPPNQPQNWQGYLRADYIRWRLMGSPDFDARREKARDHEDALVRMGYFDRRLYYTSNFSYFVVRRIRENSIHDPLMFFHKDLDGRLEAIAHKDDFPLIERIIQEMEADAPFE